MERLQLVQNNLSGPTSKTHSHVSSAWDFLHFDDLFPTDVKKFRREFREWLEREIKPLVADAYEKAELPEKIVTKLAEYDIIGKFLQKPYGDEAGNLALAAATVEIARIDASVATFFLVHLGLAAFTIESFASQEQKDKYLPLMRQLKCVSGWGLTEENIGSDASSLTTNVTKVEGGYRLNGTKRWIGNANKDIVLVWARNNENKKVECFIVQINSPGLKAEVIKRKLALRMVQNMHLTFDNVFIPEANRLPKAVDFSSTSKVLMHSRIYVAWIACGISIGVYDSVINYVNERKQFGVKITSFQLIQEKLVRMMANIQAMIHLCHRITVLYDQKKVTIGMIAMTKAWCTKMGREVCQLGREAMGGNGIIIDNYAMKGLADMEAIHTYEGTYDINTLVAGRELTGIAAFKAGK